MNGRVTVGGTDSGGKKITHVIEVVDGEIMDNTFRIDGNVTHHIAYGRFESIVTPADREVVRFNKGTGKGRHGKSIRSCKVFGQDASKPNIKPTSPETKYANPKHHPL